jgi:DNA-binding Lrp family transcriptional regulator
MDALDHRLLDEFQRDLPLVTRPYAALGVHLGISERQVIDRLARLIALGKVARVGATVRPNTAGASTLAALAVPEDRLEEVAALVGAEPGVNHSYQREDDWNLWFVATAPGPAALAACLSRIETATGLPVLDLPLRRAFNIDLGFRLTGAPQPMHADQGAAALTLSDRDRALLHGLSQGLPLLPHPFAAFGPEEAVLDRIATLTRARIITRLGVIVRHRALGYTANAMVVWDIAPDRVEAAGLALAAHPGVTLCYQRETVPGVWPFALYSMIHATSRPAALQVLAAAQALPELQGAVARPLFSTRCFKQTGARIVEVAA